MIRSETGAFTMRSGSLVWLAAILPVCPPFAATCDSLNAFAAACDGYRGRGGWRSEDKMADPGGGRGPDLFKDLRVFCRVAITLRHRAIPIFKIKIWLPADGWKWKVLLR